MRRQQALDLAESLSCVLTPMVKAGQSLRHMADALEAAGLPIYRHQTMEGNEGEACGAEA
ncbi:MULTISPECIES: hypothetical protein [unclassified Synechococcus]|uniref:hypothetical protein n=1 Tax=unclassified Synechococcus TaxID=2626047 RepID=UPI0039B070B5